MKILMLTSFLDCGGAETHIASLAEGIKARGHTVCVASSGGRVAKALELRGIEHIRLPLGSRSPIALLAARKKLEVLCKRRGFDIIHAHSRIPAFLVCGIAKEQSIPFVTTVHARFRIDPVLRRLSKWGTLTLAVSEDLKQYLVEEYRVFSDNIFVVPNGIDTERFSPLGSDEERKTFNVVFVSRLDRDCSLGAELLCSIAPRLRKVIPNLKITICGGGGEYKAIKKRAEKINRRIGYRCVETAGYLENTAEILRQSDLFVGVSRAALEAMATALPTVLCGNEGYFGIITPESFSEAAEENFCGRGEAIADGDKLFGDVLELYNMDAEKRRALGRALRKEVCRINQSDETAISVEKVYRAACERVPSRHGEIVLCGFYGFGNMGDDCLLSEAIRRCRLEHEEASISALTLGGERDEERFGVRCVKRSSLFSVAEEIKRADVFVFGGGTLLQDRTSRRSLLYYTSLLRYASRMGVRCELWGNGIGAPVHKYSARKIAEALSGCGYVGLRDSLSVKLARDICAEEGVMLPQIVYEKDLAMSLSRTSRGRTELLLKKYSVATSSQGGFVVATVCGKAGRGSIKILSNEISKRKARGEGILFVPMFPKEDIKLTKRLAKKLGGCVAKPMSGRDLTALMSKSNGVIGMRLHSLIFAFMAGVSFVGLGDDSKIESFCRDNGGTYYTDIC